MPGSRQHALTHERFTGEGFAPTRWSSAQDKADFANALCRFITEDFPRPRWKKPFYRRLSQCFGHIACYDLDGFWGTFFASLEGKVEFLEQLQAHSCHGSPDHTYCDVERAVQARLRAYGVLETYRIALAMQVEHRERALLAALRAKYDGPCEGRPGVVPPQAAPCHGTRALPTGPRPAVVPSTREAGRPAPVRPTDAPAKRRRADMAAQPSLL